MTISDDFQKKLEALRKNYKNELPNKMQDILALYKSLAHKQDLETLKQLHLKVHSLHGNSATFGDVQLAESAARLEASLKNLLSQPETIVKQLPKLQELLNNIEVLSNKDIELTSATEIQKPSLQSKFIYLLDDDVSWQAEFIKQMQTFGYQIQKFTDSDVLLEELQNKKNAILILNIALIDVDLEKWLSANNEKTNSSQNMSKVPIIFISTSGEFSLRLRSVRLGGSAYYVKPFLIDELVKQIDHLLKHDEEPYKVLIVDDEINVANYYATILEQARFKSHIITQAKEIDRALHIFNPDLILIDLLMPGCNGVELATIIRQQSKYQNIPIIFLSAEEDQLIQLNAMKIGADDFVTKSTPPNYLIMKVRNRVDRYKKVNALIVRDSLTGLYDHPFMQNQLEIEVKESLALHNPLSIALVDLDGIKNINETYGHQAGDLAMRSLSLILTKKLHANDIVGRYLGEKLLVILPNTTSDSAKKMIDDIRKQFLTLNYTWNDQIFNATFSAGIASFPTYHNDADLLEAANDAMLKAKKLGRNRVELAD